MGSPFTFLFSSLSISFCALLVLLFLFFCCFLFFENEGDFVSYCFSCSSFCMIIIQYSVSYSISSPVQLASGEDASHSLLSQAHKSSLLRILKGEKYSGRNKAYQKEKVNVAGETFTQDYILSNLLFSTEGIYRENILTVLTRAHCIHQMLLELAIFEQGEHSVYLVLFLKTIFSAVNIKVCHCPLHELSLIFLGGQLCQRCLT